MERKLENIMLFEEYSFVNESKKEIRFDDYPESAVNNAKKALRWKEEYGNEVKAGTAVGWARANQLANRENLSLETVKRMKAFFDRHQGNEKVDPKYKDEPWRDNGYIMHLAWGGISGWNWAKGKIESYNKK